MEKLQIEMLKELEFLFVDFKELQKYCENENMMFLSTHFNIESAIFFKDLGLEIFKIPSGEITNYLLLQKVGSYGKRVILSTGMADLGAIEDALDVLIENGTKRENIMALHCNTKYPTPYENVKLLAMLTIKEAFRINVGYSDHTLGIEVSLAAVAIGATVIEKHFTLDKNMCGPDYKASLEPQELKEMIKAIRNVEKALGKGVKNHYYQSEKIK